MPRVRFKVAWKIPQVIKLLPCISNINSKLLFINHYKLLYYVIININITIMIIVNMMELLRNYNII